MHIELEYVFPDFAIVQDQELTDSEVIQLAQDANSFAFLDSEEEDIYNNHPALRQF